MPNKIIFTDGEAPMPEKAVRDVIWVVFGEQIINPIGGRVINIKGEQLKKLEQNKMRFEGEINR